MSERMDRRAALKLMGGAMVAVALPLREVREPGVWRKYVLPAASGDGCLANEVDIWFGPGVTHKVRSEDAESVERFGRHLAILDVRGNPMVTTWKDAVKMGEAVLRDLAWPVNRSLA